MRKQLLTVTALTVLLTGCPTEEMDTPSEGPSDPAADPSVPAPEPEPEPNPDDTGDTGPSSAAGETGDPMDPELECIGMLMACEAELAECKATK